MEGSLVAVKNVVRRFVPETTNIGLQGHIHALWAVHQLNEGYLRKKSPMSSSGSEYRRLDAGTSELFRQQEKLIGAITAHPVFKFLKVIKAPVEVSPEDFIISGNESDRRAFLGNPGWGQEAYDKAQFRLVGRLVDITV